ncbi:hypothetical protein [Halanaerobacter jeridensis]|uniref:Lipoprotein n=1 Tax=Halanaerobacter jeridensis TaxID=706427 RepID=A0A938XND4_9FIRM|nr:hypothetical protein [Halanaerobacter jeridensis]MBM7555583.1 hypothetical protein [Halanaerobacter jeridensis]
MKKKAILICLALLLVVSGSCLAEDKKEEEGIDINRNINLIVQEKDPQTAYELSLTPVFGPEVAANYVSHKPIEWQGNKNLIHKANAQTMFNLSEILAGLVLGIAAEEDEDGNGGVYVASGFLVAYMHNHFFGKDMAEEAVEYNKKLYEKFDWNPPKVKLEK